MVKNVCDRLTEYERTVFMKVKNMVRNRQSSYMKLIQMSNKSYGKNILVGIVALLLAFLGSKVNNGFLMCLCSVISLVLAGAETVFKLVKGTKDSKLDNLMVVVAIAIPFCTKHFVLAATAMSVYKLSTAVIAWLLSGLGKKFKEFNDVCPKYANVIDENSNILVVPAESVIKGTKLMVKSGEIVPVDCMITEGFSDFDTSRVFEQDGEVSMSSGDKILAGFVNTGSSVTCVTVCDYDDSIAKDMSRIADMSETSSTVGEKRFIKISKWYPALVMLVALAVLLFYGISANNWAKGMSVVSVLLIAATTSSFTISVPLFTSCSIWNLKKKGIAISSAELLDEIADINCVAFEKNGILTDGNFKICDTYMAEGISEEDLLMITGMCVGGRTHPISRIFTKYINEHLKAENVMEFPGKGVECTIMGKTFLCGTEDFIKESGVDVSEIPGYRLYITIDKVVMGAVSYEDELSESSVKYIEALRKVGVEKITMFTADKDEKAKIAFGVSGADEYVAELTPFARAEAISKIKQEDGATVAYIGESLGGEQALNEADVGITIVDKETSGIEFCKVGILGKLKTLADAIEAARNSNSKLEVHFYCASAAKIIITLLAIFSVSFLNVAVALGIDAVLTIAAILSAKDLLKK